MKKALSLSLAAAMLGSAFAGIANAADLTPQQQFDALKNAGIFAGVNAKGDAGLDLNMNRAQLAVIISKLNSLKENAAGASYTDVKPTQWWTGWIGAATAGKLMDGTGSNQFTPAGTVTIEQMAVVVAKSKGLKESTAAVDGKVSDWAKGWVAAALAAGLLPKSTDYTVAAKRGDLVASSYLVYDQTQKVSVASAKVTGLQKVVVALSRPVDTTKATFSLKRGTIDVALDASKTVWSEDKKTATLTLKDVKVTEGTYTVTLGGLVADQLGTASATFTATNEAISSIEFLGGDTIAASDNAKIRIKPLNQYGELVSQAASSYTVLTNSNTNASLSKTEDGYLLLTLDTLDNSLLQGVSVLPITVYHNETRTTVSKNFKIGTTPFVSKIELGAPKYSNGAAYLANKGDFVTVPVNQFDQYGNPVTAEQNTSASPVAGINVTGFVTPYDPGVGTPVESDINNDNVKELKVTLNDKVEKNVDYTVTAFSGSAQATTKISVKSVKVATKVEFADFSGVLAAGDVDKYVTINAYDVDGNKLSAQELVDNQGRINTFASGVAGVSVDAQLVKYGEHKGQIHISNIPYTAKDTTIFLSAQITTIGTQSIAQKPFKVQDVRKPETIVVDTEAATKAVRGATSGFKFIVKDQYGETFSGWSQKDASGNVVAANPTITENGGSVTYSVYVSVANLDNNSATGISAVQDNGAALAAGGLYVPNTTLSTFNNGFKFTTTDGLTGRAQFKAELRKTVSNVAGDKVVKSITREIEAIKNSTPLTYSVNNVATLYAAKDSGLLPASDASASLENVKPAKQVTVSAKDLGGNTVAYPDLVKNVTVSNQNVLIPDVDGGAVDGTVTGATYKAYVLGNKAGTASVSVVFETADRGSQTLTTDVTVKADPIVIDSISSDGTASYTTGANANTLLNVTVKDQYGVEYNKADVLKYDRLLGVRYTVSDINVDKDAAGNAKGSVTVDSVSGAITISGTGVHEFVLKATAPNGKSTTTLVTQ